jgi:hypothetical protein
MLGLGLSLTARPVIGGSGAVPADLDLNFLADPFDARLTVTRSGTATRFNASGLLETVAANTARIDHDPVTLTRRGLLVEESRTNLMTYSAEMDNAAWVKNLVTVSPNFATGPDGATSADKVTPNASAGVTFAECRQDTSLVSGVTYTFSTYAKASGYPYVQTGGSSAIFGTFVVNWDLSTGTETAFTAGTSAVIGRGISSVGNGWYRVWATVTALSAGTGRMTLNIVPAAASARGASWTPNGTDGVLMWGAQLEAGAFPTSYIPTSGTAVTRQLDFISMPVDTWFNASAGTLLCDFTPFAINQSVTLQTTAYLDDTTSNERMGFRASSGALAFLVLDNNVTQASPTVATGMTAGTNYRMAGAYALNDVAACVNGGTVLTDTAATIPTVTRLLVGARFSAIDPGNGHFRRVRYFKTRKPNAELQSLTA